MVYQEQEWTDGFDQLCWHAMPAGHSPVVYLVDGWLDFVKVRCCSSLVQQGLEEVVKPLALVALSNLQLRAHPSSPIHSAIPGLYAGDLVSFSTNPKEPHLQEAAAQLRTLVQVARDWGHFKVLKRHNQTWSVIDRKAVIQGNWTRYSSEVNICLPHCHWFEDICICCVWFEQGQEHFFRTAEERLCNLVQGSVQCLPPPPWTPGWKADAKPNARTTVSFCWFPNQTTILVKLEWKFIKKKKKLHSYVRNTSLYQCYSPLHIKSHLHIVH